MPHYLLTTAIVARSQLHAALELQTQRFPEVSVEHRFTTHEPEAHDLWLCRAPSDEHLTRWAAAAGIPCTSVCCVAHEAVHRGSGRTRSRPI